VSALLCTTFTTYVRDAPALVATTRIAVSEATDTVPPVFPSNVTLAWVEDAAAESVRLDRLDETVST
jgi:hypothetical protein